MKYFTFLLLATQLATYANGKPIPVEEVPQTEQVEVRDLEFHELQAFFKRAADDAAPAAPAISSEDNPFKTEDLTTEPPPNDLFGRDDAAPAAPAISSDDNPFQTEELTTTPPSNDLFGRDDAPVAPPLPADDNPFKTEELTTEPPTDEMLGRSVEPIKHPRNLKKRAAASADKSFDLTQVENPHHQPQDGQTAYIKSYGKFSKDLPPSLRDASKSNSKLKQKLGWFPLRMPQIWLLTLTSKTDKADWDSPSDGTKRL